MTLQGAEHLLARGYHYGNIAAANELLIKDGYQAVVSERGIIRMFRRGANVGYAGSNTLTRAGIKVRRSGGNLELLSPQFNPLRTPGEDYQVAYVLPPPSYRPAGASIRFSPTQKLKEGEAAKGEVHLAEGGILDLKVKPIHHTTIQAIVERLQAGKKFEFFRTGETVRQKLKPGLKRGTGGKEFSPLDRFIIPPQQKQRLRFGGIFGRGLKGKRL